MAFVKFPEDFLWGTATASYQIEGGFNEGGRGESIWDRFSHIPGKIDDGKTGDVACDHYHLYKKDIKLMKELGLRAYRLSIAWPRIFPDGSGKPNQKGIDFYGRLLTMLCENGIKPAVTLYHWDLPQKLQDKGGWANRDTADRFAEYASYIYKELGDLVPYFITHNEPPVVTYNGNYIGNHAPGITDFSTALQVAHNILLSHGKAVEAYRASGHKGEIGITMNETYAVPKTDSPADIAAAKRGDGYWNRWFCDPVFKGSYPADMVEWYKQKGVVLPKIHDGDLKTISVPLDFVGLNYYFATAYSDDQTKWPVGFSEDFVGGDRTDMGWGINPDGLYQLLRGLDNYQKGIKVFVTENGTAVRDIVNREGKVEDDNRINYLYNHFLAAHKAKEDGVNLQGYFVWSLLDNFEWACGYTKRFGLVYVDYNTQKRIVKKSGGWFCDVIKNNGFERV